MSNVIPFNKEDPKCNFCGTPKSAAKKFFSTDTGRHICGRCIEKCVELLKGEKQ